MDNTERRPNYPVESKNLLQKFAAGTIVQINTLLVTRGFWTAHPSGSNSTFQSQRHAGAERYAAPPSVARRIRGGAAYRSAPAWINFSGSARSWIFLPFATITFIAPASAGRTAQFP